MSLLFCTISKLCDSNYLWNVLCNDTTVIDKTLCSTNNWASGSLSFLLVALFRRLLLLWVELTHLTAAISGFVFFAGGYWIHYLTKGKRSRSLLREFASPSSTTMKRRRDRAWHLLPAQSCSPNTNVLSLSGNAPAPALQPLRKQTRKAKLLPLMQCRRGHP